MPGNDGDRDARDSHETVLADGAGLIVGILPDLSNVDNEISQVIELPERMEHHDLLSGLVRLHILHHAARHPVFGQWMIDELARHGYRLSPGTLYPMLSKMERDGYLTSDTVREGRTARKFYSITDKGHDGLAVARVRLRELEGRGGTE